MENQSETEEIDFETRRLARKVLDELPKILAQGKGQ